MSAPLSHIIIVNLIIAGIATSATDIVLCIPCYMLGADVEPGLCNHHGIVLCDHKSHAISKFSRKRNVNKNLYFFKISLQRTFINRDPMVRHL